MSRKRRDRYPAANRVRLSPDGKRLAVLHHGAHSRTTTTRGRSRRSMLHVRGLDEKEPGTNLGVECRDVRVVAGRHRDRVHRPPTAQTRCEGSAHRSRTHEREDKGKDPRQAARQSHDPRLVARREILPDAAHRRQGRQPRRRETVGDPGGDAASDEPRRDGTQVPDRPEGDEHARAAVGGRQECALCGNGGERGQSVRSVGSRS